MTLEQIYRNQMRLTDKLAKRSCTTLHADRVEVEDAELLDVYLVPDGADGVAVHVNDSVQAFPTWGDYESFMIESEQM